MALIFYYAPMSSASPTHWILEELGIPYEKVKMDFASGDLKKPEFLRINPNGKVPALVHDGVPIFESVAIAIHLGETFGVEKKLFPPPGIQRAQAIQWMVWCNASLGEAISRHMHNTSERFPEELRNAKAGEIARADVENHLSILNQSLEGKGYLLGDDFSIVDAHVSSWLLYVRMVGFDLAKYPAMQAWSARCSERPANKRVD
ncbi:MAG TPA: glutathione S-transferase family protein [Polyangiaceae bacterium]|jgi:glutathione S-transferase|nr:glutathione S-transferase family protein [Polyangiaceae bacterium]